MTAGGSGSDGPPSEPLFRGDTPMIITKTPFRVSLFGGGTDYPTWYYEHGGAVLATTIDKYCYISCRHLPPFFDYRHRIVYSKVETVSRLEDIQHPAVRGVMSEMGVTRGLEIHHDGDLPARSGLGSSSAFTVGLLNALCALEGMMLTKRNLASRAIHIEHNVIAEHVGCQDQISCAFGGFNRIEFFPDNSFDVAPVIMDHQRKQDLQRHLMLFFTGFPRFASQVAKSQIDNLHARRQELTVIRETVDEAMAILQNRNRPLEELGKLLHESWRMKRRISDQVSTDEIDDMYEAGRRAGALGGKLLGAGGGGFMLFFVRPEQRRALAQRLSNLVSVGIRFEQAGSKVVVYEPNDFE